jgi:hypothetical protein
MSLKNATTVAPALILTLGLLTTSAVASTIAHDGRERHAGRAHPHTTLRQTHRRVTPHAGYAAGAHAPSDFGYVFVPGHGLLGEDCNMPTSTCPNELRDIQ